MNQARKIAQYNAPFDTGNLRYNSIRAYPLHDLSGFVLESKFTVAYYGAILDEYGAGPKRLHQGWWSQAVYSDVTSFISAVGNGEERSYQGMNEHVAKFAPDDPARKERRRKSMITDR